MGAEGAKEAAEGIGVDTRSAISPENDTGRTTAILRADERTVISEG